MTTTKTEAGVPVTTSQIEMTAEQVRDIIIQGQIVYQERRADFPNAVDLPVVRSQQQEHTVWDRPQRDTNYTGWLVAAAVVSAAVWGLWQILKP